MENSQKQVSYNYLSMSFDQIKQQSANMGIAERIIFLRNAMREYKQSYYVERWAPDKSYYLGVYLAILEELKYRWREAGLSITEPDSQTKPIDNDNPKENRKPKLIDFLSAYVRDNCIDLYEVNIEHLSYKIAQTTKDFKQGSIRTKLQELKEIKRKV